MMARDLRESDCRGIEGVAFGDLFLEDVRAYRIKQMKDTGLRTDISAVGAADPRSGEGDDCLRHASEVDLCRYGESSIGHSWGASSMKPCFSDLPEEVDPCGERGEFHSFVYAGPMLDSAAGDFGGRAPSSRSVCVCGSALWLRVFHVDWIDSVYER